jgi:hypothetical protein
LGYDIIRRISTDDTNPEFKYDYYIGWGHGKINGGLYVDEDDNDKKEG